jgi:hypothetical protein
MAAMLLFFPLLSFACGESVGGPHHEHGKYLVTATFRIAVMPSHRCGNHALPGLGNEGAHKFFSDARVVPFSRGHLPGALAKLANVMKKPS